jgi:peroxiredoxin
MADKLKGRKVVIFGLPGAFTGTCTSAHVPSFIRTKDAFRRQGRGRDHLRVGQRPLRDGAWGEGPGADAAGITMLAMPMPSSPRRSA